MGSVMGVVCVLLFRVCVCVYAYRGVTHRRLQGALYGLVYGNSFYHTH